MISTQSVADNGHAWINPIGGLGDMLMVSGVLKQAIDRQPERRWNLVRRTNCLDFLGGHPAIAAVGFPRPGAAIVGTDYWIRERLGPGSARPYQILARMFGLATPVEERLYIPGELEDDPVLEAFVPWRERNVVVAPASDSPRKVLPIHAWEALAGALDRDGIRVLQVGRLRELHVRNAFSLLGLTTPRQAIGLLRHCDLIVTSDSFLMHAAHLVGVPAVVIWGATHHSVYGYREQVHVQARRTCELAEPDDCLGPQRTVGGLSYGTACQLGVDHCLASLDVQELIAIVRDGLASPSHWAGSPW